jgi:hypothetical protein
LPVPEHERVHEQPVLVDEVVVDQRACHDAAAEHRHHGIDEVALDDRRPGQSTLVSVLVATHFGVALRWAAIGLSSGWRGQKATSRS